MSDQVPHDQDVPLNQQAPDQPLPDVSLNGLSFKSQIQKVSQTGRPNSMAILGVPKVGKTTLAASAYDIAGLRAAGKEVLILAAEKGTTSIAKHYPNVDVVFVPHHRAMLQITAELLTKPHNYGVVILDTLDRLQENAVEHLLAVGAANTQAAWGDVRKWTIDIVKKFHESPMMAIFLVHTKEEKNERTGIWKTDYALQGSATQKIGQEFDLIGLMTIRTDTEGNAVRTLQVGPTEGGITGSRWERELPPAIDNPTMPMIFDYIEGKTTTTEENN